MEKLLDLIEKNGHKLVGPYRCNRHHKYMSVFDYSEMYGGTIDSFHYYNDYVVDVTENNLSESDIQILKEFGYQDEDFEQISDAIPLTTFTLLDKLGNEEKKLTVAEARKLLGNEAFLSGIGRSSFHWTACRYVEKDKKSVYFDSSKLFK